MPPPARPGWVRINAVNYLLAPENLTRSPAIQIRSGQQDLMQDFGRPDIIPVRGGIPGEFWFWQERWDGGTTPRRYTRPYAYMVDSNTAAKADGRFGNLMLDVDAIKSVTWTDPDGDAWGVFEEDSQLLVGNKTKVFLMADVPTEDTDFTATDADATPGNAAKWERSNADVALVGTGSHIFSRNATWSNAAIATIYLAVGPDRLWKAYQSSGSWLVANCLTGNDPLTAANWSAGIRVHNAAAGLNTIGVLGDEVLLGFRTGLVSIYSDGTPFNRTVDVIDDALNGRNMTVAFGYMWYPTKNNGLYAYRDGTLWPNQGPDTATDNPKAHGFIEFMHASGNWLYAIISDTANLKSYWRARLREPTDEPGGLLKWFLWQYGVGTSARFWSMSTTDINIGSATDRMIWIAQSGSAKGWYLPTTAYYTTTESIVPPAAGLADTGRWEFPEDDFAFPWANKFLRDVVAIGRQFDSDRKIEVFGSMDGSAFTTLTITASGTKQTFSGSNISGRRISDWGLTLYDSAAGTTGPIVERFGLRFFVRPNNDRVFTLRLLISGEKIDGPAVIAEAAETQMTNLLTLSENTATISFGSSNDDYTVLVSPDIDYRLIENSAGEYQLVAEVTMEVI